MNSRENRTIPVFVYPSDLSFFIDSKKTHTQLLNLYNPYEFAVKYQVLSNTQGKFSVIDPQGTIGPHSLVDLIIKHHAPTLQNSYTKDKFLITMKDASTRELLGKRYVTAVLYPGENDNHSVSQDGHFELNEHDNYKKEHYLPNRKTRNFLIVVSVVIFLALFLPTKVGNINYDDSLYSYFILSIEVKILMAFLLGMLTFHLVWG